MNNNMKTIILFAILLGIVCLSCTHKRQQTQPEATPDKELAIMGSNDTVAGIQDSSVNKSLCGDKCTKIC